MDLSKFGQTTLNKNQGLANGYGGSFGDKSISPEERAQRAEKALDIASIAIFQLQKENQQLKQQTAIPSFCGNKLNTHA